MEARHYAGGDIQYSYRTMIYDTHYYVRDIVNKDVISLLLPLPKQNNRLPVSSQSPKAIWSVSVVRVAWAINKSGSQNSERRVDIRFEHELSCEMHYAMKQFWSGDKILVYLIESICIDRI